MDIVTKTIISRRKSIAVLESECSELDAKIRTVGPASPAGVALAGVLTVKTQRLVKLREELKGLEPLIADPRQTEIKGIKRG